MSAAGGVSFVYSAEPTQVQLAGNSPQNPVHTTTDGPQTTAPQFAISAGNSTTTPLGVNGVFTGAWEDVRQYVSINVLLNCDQIAAANGLRMEFSIDGSAIDINRPVDVTISGDYVSFPVEGAYFRLVITNGAAPQSVLRVQTIYLASPRSIKGVPLIDTITDASTASLTRAVIEGKTTAGGGGYVPVKVNPSGALAVDATGSEVSLDTATLTALETVQVGNFPAVQPVSDNGASLTVDNPTLSVVGAGAAATAQRVQLADESLAALENITVQVGEVEIKNEVGNPVPISAATLPLPTGAATAAKQLPDNHQVTVSNFPATQAVSATDLDIRNLSSAQDSVSVTGSVNVGNFPVTQVVSDGGGSLTVDGSVNVGNFPATQAVSGTVTANAGTGTFNVSVGNTVAISATDLDIRNLSSAQDSVSVTGTVALDSASLAALETIQVGNFPATQAVSATDLDIRNLSSAQDSVAVTGTVAVTATDLDIRNLNPTQDTVGARDVYTAGETLADQTTSNAVATFTFASPVQLVYVYGASPLGTNTYRADPFGGTPSASQGIPCPDGVATAIPVQTSVVRVFGASGTVSVWGFRY